MRVHVQALFSLSLAALSASCASSLPGSPSLNRMPAPMFRQSAAQAPSISDHPISVHFVAAYKGPIAENEPITRTDPKGPAAALLNLIQTARKSLDGAFYDFSDETVAEALIRAKKRGVQVRIVTDTDNMTERDTGPQGPLRGVIARLKRAGIPVVDDRRSSIMHHKFLIQDNNVVWTGSTNLTPTSLYQHNNNALTLRIPQLAANYSYEFNRMFVERIFGPNPPRQLPYPVIQFGNTTIRTFFSPRGDGQAALLNTLAQARKRISFMTFSFTDKDLGALMVQKRQAGVRVEGVFDQCLGYGKFSQYHNLHANKIYTRMDGNQALLHHKVLIADDTVVTGSFNFSANADKSNNENMLIIQNSYVSSMFRQEYERVMFAAENNNPPPGKCPGQDDPDPPEPNRPVNS